MTDIEQKALALVNKVTLEKCEEVNLAPHVSLCAALRLSVIEHEAFRQEVSNAVKETLVGLENDCHTEAVVIASNELLQFILPTPKPDPLFDVLWDLGMAKDRSGIELMANRINETLDARGFEIREKG